MFRICANLLQDISAKGPIPGRGYERDDASDGGAERLGNSMPFLGFGPVWTIRL
jgi:hypothetical protein